MIEFRHQGTTAEETALQKLHQGVCTHVLHYHACLNFLVLFFQEKKNERKIKTNPIAPRVLSGHHTLFN